MFSQYHLSTCSPLKQPSMSIRTFWSLNFLASLKYLRAIPFCLALCHLPKVSRSVSRKVFFSLIAKNGRRYWAIFVEWTRSQKTTLFHDRQEAWGCGICKRDLEERSFKKIRDCQTLCLSVDEDRERTRRTEVGVKSKFRIYSVCNSVHRHQTTRQRKGDRVQEDKSRMQN